MPYQINNKHIVPVIEIKGRFLGSLEKANFNATVEDLKTKGTKSMVVDLSKADMIDSSGIGVLIAAYTSVRKHGGAIRLSGLENRVRGVFMMSKLLGNVFEDYQTKEEAAKSFQMNPPYPLDPEMVA
ncbi:MAG: STAS domain-containing protein [Rhodothermaceae bacterium]|nr:STAS domain-containing protein [Rhodothermaceae bacterium]